MCVLDAVTVKILKQAPLVMSSEVVERRVRLSA